MIAAMIANNPAATSRPTKTLTAVSFFLFIVRCSFLDGILRQHGPNDCLLEAIRWRYLRHSHRVLRFSDPHKNLLRLTNAVHAILALFVLIRSPVTADPELVVSGGERDAFSHRLDRSHEHVKLPVLEQLTKL